MSTHPHIVRSHDEEQTALQNSLLQMGNLAVTQLEAALDALARRDPDVAQRIVTDDARIDAIERQIEHDVIHLIQRGPLAMDLRIPLAALRVASDLERIGDLAANIAKRSHALQQAASLPQTRSLDTLGRLAARQTRDVLAAYAERDDQAALRVRERDVELDTLHTELFRELLTVMLEDPQTITPCAHLLFIAKNLERIGDHATNIAENLWFLLHGEGPVQPRDKHDASSLLS